MEEQPLSMKMAMLRMRILDFMFVIETSFPDHNRFSTAKECKVSWRADANFRHKCVKITHMAWLEAALGIAFLVACLQIHLVLLTRGAGYWRQVASLFREGWQCRLLAARLRQLVQKRLRDWWQGRLFAAYFWRGWECG